MAYSARVLAVMAAVRRDFNSATDGFLDTDSILCDWMNECKRDLAHRGYFNKSDTCDAPTSGEVDLATEFSDFVALRAVHWVETDDALMPLDSWIDYEIKQDGDAEGTPYYYYHQSGTLYISPHPEAAETDGLRIRYAYEPADMDDAGVDIPKSPKAYDRMYTYYCLWKAYFKDRTSIGATELGAYYEQEYQKAREQLLNQGRNPVMILRPYR